MSGANLKRSSLESAATSAREIVREAKTLGETSDAREVAALRTLLFELGFGEQLGWRTHGPSGDYSQTRGAVRAFAEKNRYKSKGKSVSKDLTDRMLLLHSGLEHLERLQTDVAAATAGNKMEVDGYRLQPNAELEYTPRNESLQTVLKLIRRPPIGNKLVVDGKYGKKTQRVLVTFARNEGPGGDGRALTAEVGRKLVEKVAGYYGADWRTALHEVVTDIDTGGATPPTIPTRGDSTEQDSGDPHRPVQESGSNMNAPSFSYDGAVKARLLNLKPFGQKLENWCWAASAQMMVSYLRSLDAHACPTCVRTGPTDLDLAQGIQMNRRLQNPAVDCTLDPAAKRDFDYKSCDQPGWPYLYEFEPFVQSTIWASRRHVIEERGLELIPGAPRFRWSHPLTDRQLQSITQNNGWEFRRLLDDAEGAALTWEALTALLDAHRPVAFSIRGSLPGTGHMRLAVGYAVTAGGERWVAVCDPLPPETGDVYLISYESYVAGSSGGHWRDYWVAPADEMPLAPLRQGAFHLRVGKELVESFTDFGRESRKDKKDASSAPAERLRPGELRKLDPADERAARVEAERGFEVVKAIATEAPEVALNMGIGGNFMQVFGRGVVAFLGDDKGINPRNPPAQPRYRGLEGSERLELNHREPIPVYVVTQKKLKEWDGEDVGRLLAKPRELIYEIIRPELMPFSFFAAVTVRRSGGEWSLATIGRMYLMAALATRQLVQGWREFFKPGREFGLEDLVDFLWAQGLLEPIAASLDKESIEEIAHDLNEAVKPDEPLYSQQEISDYLTGKRGGRLNLEKLRKGARALDGSEGPPKAITVPKPRFILLVHSLYQFFVSYEDGVVDPVYPARFHRPERRVERGDIETVLLRLQEVSRAGG